MEEKISNSDYGEAQNWKVLVIAFRFLEEVALSHLSIFNSKKLLTQQVKGWLYYIYRPECPKSFRPVNKFSGHWPECSWPERPAPFLNNICSGENGVY